MLKNEQFHRSQSSSTQHSKGPGLNVFFVFDTTNKHNIYAVNRQQQYKDDNMMKGKEKMKKNERK